MIKLYKLKYNIQSANPLLVIISTTITLLFIESFYHYLFLAFDIHHTSNLPKPPIATDPATLIKIAIRLVKVCLIAPLVETFVFQYLLFELFYRKFRWNLKVFYVVSAFIFGLTHFYSIPTIIVTFTVCLVFNYVYAALAEKKRKLNAYIVIVAIHSLYNASVLVNQIFS
ncbi:MAG: CPBP family intramembrane glutamic endopeptidase [Bacteroidota bacterium]